jgi:hypothetical protein
MRERCSGRVFGRGVREGYSGEVFGRGVREGYAGEVFGRGISGGVFSAPPTPSLPSPSYYSSASRHTSTETSATGRGIGGSGLVAFTHTPSSS